MLNLRWCRQYKNWARTTFQGHNWQITTTIYIYIYIYTLIFIYILYIIYWKIHSNKHTFKKNKLKISTICRKILSHLEFQLLEQQSWWLILTNIFIFKASFITHANKNKNKRLLLFFFLAGPQVWLLCIMFAFSLKQE